MPLVSFYTPWKHKTPKFSEVFRGYRKRPVVWNGLKIFSKYSSDFTLMPLPWACKGSNQYSEADAFT